MAEATEGLGQVASGKISFIDLLAAGGVKYFSERLMAPYIGNATIQSGLVKIVVAKYVGKHLPKPVKLALAIDGAEDIVTGLLSGGLGGVFDKLTGAQPEQIQVI